MSKQSVIDVKEALEKSGRMLYLDEIMELTGRGKFSVRNALQGVKGLQKTNSIPRQYGLNVNKF